MKWNIKWFVWMAVFVNMADLITAYFILPGESNPIFLGTGYWLLAVFKIAYSGLLIYWGYKLRSEHAHYYLCMALVFCIFLFGFGAWSNIQGIMNPELVAAAAAIPDEVKADAYWSIVSLLGILPMILNILTFEIFYRTRNAVQKVEVIMK